jgi:hypothetical protein
MLTALLLSLSLAAPSSGDAIYVIEGDSVVLDFAQKQDLASAVASEFPSIPPGSLDKFACWANIPQIENILAVDLAELAASATWPCYAIDGNPTVGAAAALDYELNTSGACKVKDRPSGKSILLCEKAVMDADAKILNSALTQSVFGKQLNLVFNFVCERNQQVPDEISCKANPVKIEDPDQWWADRKSDEVKVLGTIGKVK